ncbi:MAG: Type 1 glutamine amidotransferase-like domain-containing protein [Patescibacteria group bacterium]
MKGKLILSGGGDLKISYNLDKEFFSLLKNNAKILYIPIALKRDRIGFEACYDWFSNIIATHAKDKDIDFTMILEHDSVPDLKNYECVYIGGGNTFKLLDFIINKQLDKRMLDYLNSGGIVYGGSAGAIIFGKDIRTVEEENDHNYIYVNGLNCIDGYSLICHYNISMDVQIIENSKKINGKILAIDESSGIIVSEDSSLIIGNIAEFDPTNDTKKICQNHSSIKLSC